MTPIYRINANGQNITKTLQERTASIEVQDSDGTDSDSCTITCSRRNLIIPPTGAQLEVKFGYASPSSSLVTCPISSYSVAFSARNRSTGSLFNGLKTAVG